MYIWRKLCCERKKFWEYQLYIVRLNFVDESRKKKTTNCHFQQNLKRNEMNYFWTNLIVKVWNTWFKDPKSIYPFTINRKKQYHLLELIKMYNNDRLQKMNRSICCLRQTYEKHACEINGRLMILKFHKRVNFVKVSFRDKVH